MTNFVLLHQNKITKPSVGHFLTEKGGFSKLTILIMTNISYIKL